MSSYCEVRLVNVMSAGISQRTRRQQTKSESLLGQTAKKSKTVNASPSNNETLMLQETPDNFHETKLTRSSIKREIKSSDLQNIQQIPCVKNIQLLTSTEQRSNKSKHSPGRFQTTRKRSSSSKDSSEPCKSKVLKTELPATLDNISSSNKEIIPKKGKKRKKKEKNIWERKITGAQRVSKRLSNLKNKNKPLDQMDTYHVIKRKTMKTRGGNKVETVEIKKYIKNGRSKESTRNTIYSKRTNGMRTVYDKPNHVKKLHPKKVFRIPSKSGCLASKVTCTISERQSNSKQYDVDMTDTTEDGKTTLEQKNENVCSATEDTIIASLIEETKLETVNSESTATFQDTEKINQNENISIGKTNPEQKLEPKCDTVNLKEESIIVSDVIILDLESGENVMEEINETLKPSSEESEIPCTDSKAKCETSQEHDITIEAASSTIDCVQESSIEMSSSEATAVENVCLNKHRTIDQIILE